MRKLLLTFIGLLALSSTAIAQPLGPVIGPGPTPCANTACSITTLTVTGAGTVTGTLTASAVNGFAVGGAGVTNGFQVDLYQTGAGLASLAPLYWTGGNLNGSPDTGLSRTAAGVIAAGNGTQGSTTGAFKGTYISGGSTPTLTGTCTTGGQTGGNIAGSFTATCTAQTVIITFATTAPNGWICNAQDQTTIADTLKQTAGSSSTTSCTLTGTTVAADRIVFTATAF